VKIIYIHYHFKVRGGLKEASYAHQGSIYLIKNTVKSTIVTFKITIFCFGTF